MLFHGFILLMGTFHKSKLHTAKFADFQLLLIQISVQGVIKIMRNLLRNINAITVFTKAIPIIFIVQNAEKIIVGFTKRGFHKY